MFSINLAHLLDRRVRLEAHEAVAIAQEVIAQRGWPAPENVEVRSDGSIACIRAADALKVSDAAALLHWLLPPDVKAPAALRYNIARGRGEVDAPPFESIDAFSAALARFERAPRADVVRGLLQRVALLQRAAGARRDGAVVQRPHAAPPRRSRAPLYVALALAASAIAGFLFMRAATLREAHSMSQSAAAASAAVPAPSPEGTAAVAPPPAPRAVASTGRSDRTQPVAARAFSPAFSPDGGALFLQTGGTRDPSSAIAIATLPGSADREPSVAKLVDDGSRNYHARPSPDGRWLAFDSDRDGERGVYVAARDGSHARRISGPGYAALPSWSPDGSRLAYIRAEPSRPSVWNLWVQPAEAGGRARRITRYAYGQTWTASWFPDNRRVCYTHEDALIVLDLQTGRWRRYRSPVSGALVRTPAVSPDGSTIAFQVLRDGMWMLDLPGGAMRRVLADPTAEEFAWSPDGARIAFHSHRNGEWGIYLFRLG